MQSVLHKHPALVGLHRSAGIDVCEVGGDAQDVVLRLLIVQSQHLDDLLLLEEQARYASHVAARTYHGHLAKPLQLVAGSPIPLTLRSHKKVCLIISS